MYFSSNNFIHIIDHREFSLFIHYLNADIVLGTNFTRIRNEPFCIIQGRDVTKTINNVPLVTAGGEPITTVNL